jgi:hypothetical protein
MPKPKGKKNDTGKLRYDLIPPDAMHLLAHVYTTGAEEYSDRNWEDGINFGRLIAAGERHLQDFKAGQNVDPDGTQHHMASLAWIALAIMSFQLRGMTNFDDRPGRMHTTREVLEALEELGEE